MNFSSDLNIFLFRFRFDKEYVHKCRENRNNHQLRAQMDFYPFFPHVISDLREIRYDRSAH
jgi:hypothetical protein